MLPDSFITGGNVAPYMSKFEASTDPVYNIKGVRFTFSNGKSSEILAGGVAGGTVENPTYDFSADVSTSSGMSVKISMIYENPQ